MPWKEVTSAKELTAAIGSSDDLKIVGFFGSFSSTAQQTLPAFREFADRMENLEVLYVDLGKAKGAHKPYGVSSVPTALTLRGGKVIRQAVGKQSAEVYERMLVPHEALMDASGDEEAKPRHRVVVYVSPTCSWCTRVKSHLRKHRIQFREIDVSVDPNAANELVRRSGQTGVPQVDIDGNLVVGFDRPKINRLLDLPEAA